MKKPLVLAMLSGLILVGAAYPDVQRSGHGRHAESTEGGQPYRPCRSRRDDNCIQLYERGVRAAYARWVRDGDPGYDEAVRYAVYQDRADRRAGEQRRHRERFAEHRTERRGHAAPPARHGHARRQHARLTMADVSRCDDRVVTRQITRQRMPAPRPAPRPRAHEDSGVRGM